MTSKNNDNREKKNKGKTTWGNVEPGPRTEGEHAALNSAEANAQHPDSDNVSSTNMDPEPHESERSEPSEEDSGQDWQNLSKEEKKRSDNRNGGYPKN